jgi:hypothetical protein
MRRERISLRVFLAQAGAKGSSLQGDSTRQGDEQHPRSVRGWLRHDYQRQFHTQEEGVTNCHRATYKQAMGGFQALIRLPRDGFLKPVCGKGGRPTIYNTALAAQEAATRALEAYLDGNLRRDGETLSGKRSEAEKVFAKLRRRAG